MEVGVLFRVDLIRIWTVVSRVGVYCVRYYYWSVGTVVRQGTMVTRIGRQTRSSLLHDTGRRSPLFEFGAKTGLPHPGTGRLLVWKACSTMGSK